MIYVGLDDTDTLDTPGTNKLARHLAELLRPQFACRMILRHQLLHDPRVPFTRKNGSASIWLEALDESTASVSEIADQLSPVIEAWCPAGSDPGLCVVTQVPEAVVEWGRRAKQEVVTQAETRVIAADAGLVLRGLGGTQDGVIGALAAVGLMATRNDGRVVYLGHHDADLLDVSGVLSVDAIHTRHIDEVRDVATGEAVDRGDVHLAKRLRPNYRRGRIVLFVERQAAGLYEAVRFT